MIVYQNNTIFEVRTLFWGIRYYGVNTPFLLHDYRVVNFGPGGVCGEEGGGGKGGSSLSAVAIASTDRISRLRPPVMK